MKCVVWNCRAGPLAPLFDVDDVPGVLCAKHRDALLADHGVGWRIVVRPLGMTEEAKTAIHVLPPGRETPEYYQ